MFAKLFLSVADREAVLTVQGGDDMGAARSKEAGQAASDVMPTAPDQTNHRDQTAPKLVPFTFGKEANRRINDLKLWEQRSETVELELIGRR